MTAPNTVTVIAMPGNVVIHHALLMYCLPSASIKPHVTVGDLTPNPRKFRDDSARIVMPIWLAAKVIPDEITFRRIWTNMRRKRPTDGTGRRDVFQRAHLEDFAADHAGVGYPTR